MQHAKDFTRKTVKRSDRETVSLRCGRAEKKRDHRTRHHVFYRLQSAYGETYDCCREPARRHLQSSIDDLETPIGKHGGGFAA